MEAIKKWFGELRSEFPIFAQLCMRTGRLLTAKLHKEDVSTVKAEVVDLWRRSLKAQIVVVIVAGLVIVLCIRGCGEDSGSTSGIVRADADLKKFAMEMVRDAQNRVDAAAKEAVAAREKATAEAEARSAKDKERFAEFEALCVKEEKEGNELEASKKAAYEELVKSMKGRAHKIIVEKGWPQIKFEELYGLTLAEPLPAELVDFSKAELPLKEPFLGGFTSLQVNTRNPISEESRVESEIVERIRLKGNIHTKYDNVVAIVESVVAKVSKILNVKPKDYSMPGNLGFDVKWSGLPSWEASLVLVLNRSQDGRCSGDAVLTIDCGRGQSFSLLVCGQIEEEWRSLLEKHEAEFDARKNQLKNDFARRRNEVMK